VFLERLFERSRIHARYLDLSPETDSYAPLRLVRQSTSIPVNHPRSGNGMSQDQAERLSSTFVTCDLADAMLAAIQEGYELGWP
jgi:hypothetical protein